MPHSSHFPISLMLEHVVQLQPRRVLDVGVGYGKFGFLIREALDFTQDRHARETWTHVIDGVEAFPAYESPLYGWVYDRVFFGDAVAVIPTLEPYDLVVLGDVIEHMDKPAAMELMRHLLQGSTNVLVSTPLDFFQQEIQSNPWETHRSHWTLQDFGEWNLDYDVAGGFGMVVLLAGRKSSWPDARRSRTCRLLYSSGPLRRRGAVARIVKTTLDHRGHLRAGGKH